MEENKVLLQAIKVSKSFSGVQALGGVHFILQKGEIQGLVGENGAGKSTFVKILGGIYRKDSGEIRLNGDKFEPTSVYESSQKGISIVHQESGIVPDLTVAENIFLNELTDCGRILLKWRKLFSRAEKWMEELGLEIDPKLRAGILPVGQQKLVELVKALCTEPNILIVDEITANLDAKEEELLFINLRRFVKEKGISVIYISHRLREIFEYCDVVTIFKDGKVVTTKKVNETNINELSTLMVGRQIKKKGYYRTDYEDKDFIDDPLLKVRDLSLSRFYEDISFDLYRGEILGIGGLSDAGHQELALTLFGVLHPDKGKIYLQNKEIHPHSPTDAINYGIGYLPRDRDLEGLILIHSISDNISLPVLDKLCMLMNTINFRKKKLMAKVYYKRLRIRARDIDALCMSLSGGNRQKVVLAKWLASEAKVLILNHPTRGADVGVKQEIYELMRNLAQRHVSIIMISDELPELIGMSDRILIMRMRRIAYLAHRGERPTEEKLVKYILK